MILAIRAIWDCWNNGTKLDFRGDFYTPHADDAVLQPRARTRTATPKIFLAGVGELMTEVAGEVVRRLPLPRLHDRAVPPRGHAPGARAGPGEGGQDDGGLRDRRARASSSPAPTRRRWRPRPRAPASRSPSTARRRRTAPVLELHGWGGLQDELNALSKQGKWVEMGDAHRRRDPQHVRRRRRARADRPRAAPALRRRASSASASTPRTRPTPTAGGRARGAQGRLTPRRPTRAPRASRIRRKPVGPVGRLRPSRWPIAASGDGRASSSR